MKSAKSIILVTICCLFVACSTNQKIEIVEPVRVKVEKIEHKQLENNTGFSGVIEEESGADLSFAMGGTIKKLYINIGDKVKQGQLIGVLDDASVRNSYNIAKSTKLQAEDAFERSKLLFDNNSLAEIKWVEVQSVLKQAVAAEQIALKSLEDCNLYAPFNGVVASKSVDEGQNIMPGMPIARLVKTDNVKVKISVPESEISNLNIGQNITINVSALRNKEFSGKVIEKGISANLLSRSYDVKALINNSDKDLMVGMLAQVYIKKTNKNKHIIIPNTSVLLDNNNNNFVWIDDAGTAKKRSVKIGELTNNGVVVLEGLSVGDALITEGQHKISEGMEIVTINE